MALNETLKVMKLSSGEDLMAKVTDDGDDVILKDVTQLQIHPAPDGSGTIVIVLTPFAYDIYTDRANLRFPRTSIMAMHDPVAKMVEEYNKKFSQILMPDSGLITPPTSGPEMITIPTD
jgi:hypothetical protein